MKTIKKTSHIILISIPENGIERDTLFMLSNKTRYISKDAFNKQIIRLKNDCLISVKNKRIYIETIIIDKKTKETIEKLTKNDYLTKGGIFTNSFTVIDM
jgi:hypothetical protein